MSKQKLPTITAKQHIVFWLVDIKQLSITQVAKHLEIRPEAVRWRLNEARQRLGITKEDFHPQKRKLPQPLRLTRAMETHVKAIY